MPVAFLTITPLGTATPSVSAYVAGVERVLRASGLNHQLTAMGTIIEGDLDAILKVVREMHEHPFTQGAQRVCQGELGTDAVAIGYDVRRYKNTLGLLQQFSSVGQNERINHGPETTGMARGRTGVRPRATVNR